MIYRFGPFELDLATVELRGRGEILSLEPQVFALLAVLVENHDRLVSKDEIIEKVWDGRVVSDAAVASRVKSARQALGDDGQAQRFIRTVHGQGFRFVAEINALRGSAGHCGLPGGAGPGGYDIGSLAHQLARVSRPSIAVLPFRVVGANERYPALASALPDELICDLSRLRWLLVTARGSSFRVRADREFSEIGRLLGVRYCLSGAIEVSDRRFWLEGDLESSLSWLERATNISPNYAQGIYARAWTEALGDRPSEARQHVDLAMRLSPIDPLYYAMMATRAFTHLAKGEDAEAADWAERGARAPGAHVLIAMIAAAAQSLGGNLERARWWAANVRERNAALGRGEFVRAFPMKSDSTRARVVQALMQRGF